MSIIIMSLFFTIVMMAFFEKSKKLHVWKCLFFSIVLSTLAAYRPSYMPDYEMYKAIYETENLAKGELFFMQIIHIFNSYNISFISFLFVYALIAIFLKIYAISLLSPFKWLSLLVYISNVFIVNDLIQIRVAVAAGIMLFSIYFAYKRNLKAFLFTSIAAVLFHNTAIAIFPIWFLNSKRINIYLYSLFIPLSYILVISGIQIGYLIENISYGNISSLWQLYQDTVGEQIVNIFSVIQILQCMVCYFFLFSVKNIGKIYPMAILMTKIYVISITAFVVLSDIQVLAYRISELYQTVQILLFPSALFVFRKQSVIAKGAVVFVAFAFLFMNIFYNGYLDK